MGKPQAAVCRDGEQVLLIAQLKLGAGLQGDYGHMNCPSQEIPIRQDGGTSAAHCTQARAGSWRACQEPVPGARSARGL
uniref:Uncharacterized protein n=1 Tax=Melopsittacus undulatus TaxID=13146 RepID=A0A8C6JLJ1_MELUD